MFFNKTLGGEVFWDTISSYKGYKLQENSVFGNCRIIDSNDYRIDFGSEAKMRKILVKIKIKDMKNKLIKLKSSFYVKWKIDNNSSEITPKIQILENKLNELKKEILELNQQKEIIQIIGK